MKDMTEIHISFRSCINYMHKVCNRMNSNVIIEALIYPDIEQKEKDELFDYIRNK